MPTIRTGLVTSEEAFGKSGVDFDKAIKQIGWVKTPFLSMIQRAAPADRSSNAALGHSWFYDEVPDGEKDNAHIEGGPAAQLKKFNGGGKLINHYQIVKRAFGVSNTEAQAKQIDGKSKLSRELEMASIDFKKSMEKILLSDQAAKARVNTGTAEAGKCGGLKSFATIKNTIDAASKELNWDHILAMLELGWAADSEYSVIMTNTKQLNLLNKMLDEKKQASMDTSYLGTNVLTIKNTAYASNVRIIANPFLAQNEIIAFRSEDIYLVQLRPMNTRDLPTSNDEIVKEIVSEFTLRVCTPVAFAWLKNLKVS